MFQHLQPHLNPFVQAAVMTRYKGGELQKRLTEDKEKPVMEFFYLLKDEQKHEQMKPQKGQMA